MKDEKDSSSYREDGFTEGLALVQEGRALSMWEYKGKEPAERKKLED